MTLLQLKYILAIADFGTMHRAAEQLNITQPALTKALSSLEEELGITIFTRASRGLYLTPEGESFVHNARLLIDQANLLVEEYKSPRGTVQHFGVSTQHYSFVVNAFVSAVSRFDPELYDFSLRETTTREVIRDVAELHSDIGILFRSAYNQTLLMKLLRDNNLTFTSLAKCSAFVYVSQSHPLATEPYLTLEQLAPYPYLVFDQGENSSGFLNEELVEEGRHSKIIRATDRATMLDLMVGLNGYTVCSGLVSSRLNSSRYTVVPFGVPGERETVELGYIRKNDLLLNHFTGEFLTALKDNLSESLPASGEIKE